MDMMCTNVYDLFPPALCCSKGKQILTIYSNRFRRCYSFLHFTYITLLDNASYSLPHSVV